MKPEGFTGAGSEMFLKHRTMMMREQQEADIQVTTPSYIGRLNMLCMQNPVYHILLGNVGSARDARDPDLE